MKKRKVVRKKKKEEKEKEEEGKIILIRALMEVICFTFYIALIVFGSTLLFSYLQLQLLLPPLLLLSSSSFLFVLLDLTPTFSIWTIAENLFSNILYCLHNVEKLLFFMSDFYFLGVPYQYAQILCELTSVGKRQTLSKIMYT